MTHHIIICPGYVPEHNYPRSFDDVVNDVWAGQVENVSGVIAIGGDDVTDKVAQACFIRSYVRAETPLPCVRTLLVEWGYCWYVEEPEDYVSPAQGRREFIRQLQEA